MYWLYGGILRTMQAASYKFPVSPPLSSLYPLPSYLPSTNSDSYAPQPDAATNFYGSSP